MFLRRRIRKLQLQNKTDSIKSTMCFLIGIFSRFSFAVWNEAWVHFPLFYFLFYSYGVLWNKAWVHFSLVLIFYVSLYFQSFFELRQVFFFLVLFLLISISKLSSLFFFVLIWFLFSSFIFFFSMLTSYDRFLLQPKQFKIYSFTFSFSFLLCIYFSFFFVLNVNFLLFFFSSFSSSFTYLFFLLFHLLNFL